MTGTECGFQIFGSTHPIFGFTKFVKPCCGHDDFPWVEFPKGSGFRDPLYCDIATGCGKCPLGIQRERGDQR